MSPYDRHLQAAQGYIELGLPLAAHEELEEIEPEMRALSQVFVLRVDIYRMLEKWEAMATVARQLCRTFDYDPRWPLSLAYATRRGHSMEAALRILTEAEESFPHDPMIHFNLACYHAQLGNLDAARGRLREAFALEPACRALALDDPDLEPIWSTMPSDTVPPAEA